MDEKECVLMKKERVLINKVFLISKNQLNLIKTRI